MEKNELPKYTILTQLTINDIIEDSGEHEDLLRETHLDQCLHVFINSGYDWNRPYLWRSILINSDQTHVFIDYPDEACESLMMKEGADLVRWENGHMGWLGYYGTTCSGIELVSYNDLTPEEKQQL